MNLLLITPILLPLVTGAIMLILPKAPRLLNGIALLSSLLLLVGAALLITEVHRGAIIAQQVGNWPAPFGITLVADHFSAIMIAVTALITFSTVIYGIGEGSSEPHSQVWYSCLFGLVGSAGGAFLAGDLFNLFVWFEVMLLSSFVLLVMGNNPVQVRSAISYVVLSVVASMAFLAGIALLYGMTGALNLAELSSRLAVEKDPGLVTAVSMLFLLAFGIKAGMFPLFFWLPESYPTPPMAVSSIFSALLTKVGVYAMIRVFTLVFGQQSSFAIEVILVLSGFTMLTGVLGAVAQNEIRRILSFHIVSQIGYMTLGLGLHTEAALMASIFYIVHHIVVKANLFLIAGMIRRVGGSFRLERLGGLYATQPYLCCLFLIPALSLAGIPPLSGFWGKFSLALEMLREGRYVILFVALLAGFLTLFSMTKIWTNAFWSAEPAGTLPGRRSPVLMLLPAGLLAVITLAISFAPGLLLDLASRAARELMNPALYRAAVLGVVQ